LDFIARLKAVRDVVKEYMMGTEGSLRGYLPRRQYLGNRKLAWDWLCDRLPLDFKRRAAKAAALFPAFMGFARCWNSGLDEYFLQNLSRDLCGYMKGVIVLARGCSAITVSF
jgi:hypothetical protein